MIARLASPAILIATTPGKMRNAARANHRRSHYDGLGNSWHTKFTQI